MLKKIKNLKQKSPKKYKQIILAIIISFGILIVSATMILASDAPIINSIDFLPELDISRFASYNILSSINNLPQSENVTVSVEGINGDGGNYWNYYADGTPASETIKKNMKFDPSISKWKSSNIFPDSIYPEIFLAPSTVTWSNIPSNLTVRRNNYQILHFSNSFTSTPNMSFWIELNAYRKSQINSADLQVYLVEKGHDISYFQEDWRAKSGVEMVGVINKDSEFNHTHSQNSSHHLVALSSNANGTFGVKNLDINGDFWIVIYSNSPSDTRGFDLRFQPSVLCDNNNRWYAGSQSGWTTNLQSGCPNVHIHIARRSSSGGIKDGVKSTVTANYDGKSGTKIVSSFYNELPNLPPNATNFINPTIGGTYAGDINVSWNSATDPNDDPLKYSIYLFDNDNNQVGDGLISNTSNTTFSFPTTVEGQEIPNGDYYLKGTVCDQGIPANEPPEDLLCTNFQMAGNFTIDNTSSIKTVSAISIASNNINTAYAKAGDTVTLNFITSGAIEAPFVALYAGGQNPINDINVFSVDNIHWSASYLVSVNGYEGEISFEISSPLLDKNYYDTTDATKVTALIQPPQAVLYAPTNQTDKVASTANLSIGFNTEVNIVNGKNIFIKKSLDDTIFETIDISNATIGEDDKTLNINPVLDFTDKTTYYILIDSGALTDNAGNQYNGIDNQ